MNPFADVTYMTVNAWRDLDWRDGVGACWVRIELEAYYRQCMRQAHAQPLNGRIGILRRAWVGGFPDTLQILTTDLATEVMEHWVQLGHDGVRCRYAAETYARRVEGQVRVFRTLPDCIAGEGGTPLQEARAMAPPAYCPPLAGDLWSVDLCDDKYDVSMMRHPIVRRSAQDLYVKWTDERTFPVDRDELERTGYVEPKMGFPSHKTLYAARELAEALIDSEALAQWRRQGLEENLQERGCSSFDIGGYYMAKKETPEQQEERLRRAEEYINGPRIFYA